MAIPPSPSSQGKLQFHEFRVLGNGLQGESAELSSHRSLGLNFSLTKVPQEGRADLNTTCKHLGKTTARGRMGGIHRDIGG